MASTPRSAAAAAAAAGSGGAGAPKKDTTATTPLRRKYIGTESVPFCAFELTRISTTCKVVIIGDGNVGKTSILLNFISGCAGTGDLLHQQTTALDMEYAWSPLDKKDPTRAIRFEFWDTAGQEKFKALSGTYIRGAHIVLIAYSLADQASFDNARDLWTSFFKAQPTGYPIAQVIYVGNQMDLIDPLKDTPKKRQKAIETILKEKLTEEMHFFVSAKTGQGTEALLATVRETFIRFNSAEINYIRTADVNVLPRLSEVREIGRTSIRLDTEKDESNDGSCSC